MLPLRNLEKYLRKWFLTFLRLSMSPLELAPAVFESAEVKSILVTLRHRMGDTVLALPMLKALRENFRHAHITLVTKSSTNYRQIFSANLFYCDELMEYEYGFDSFMNLIHELRQRTYELAVIPSTVTYSVTNHLIAYYAKVRFRVGVESCGGKVNPSAFLLNIRNDFRWQARKTHQIKRYLDVISQIGINCDDTRIHIPIPQESISFARKFLAENFPEPSRSIVGLHPGAGRQDNLWSPENYALLISRLQEEFDPYFLISEGPLDARQVRSLLDILADKYSITGITVHRGAILDNLALISLSGLFITNDTGMMHLAASTDVPMVSLFGPSNAQEWAPIGERKISIQSPTRNINDIKVEKVFEICRDLLGTRRHAPLF